MNNQINQDIEHLRILSICHYVLAGFCVFPLLYGIFYMVMGLFFTAAVATSPEARDATPAYLITGIFVGIGLVVSAVALTLGLVLIKAGRDLNAHRNHTFCFVIAVIACLIMPFGTVLGVFTIIVLLRDSVKMLFNGSPHGPMSGFSDWQ